MNINLENMQVLEVSLEGNANRITIMNLNGIPIMTDLTNNKKVKLKLL